MTQPPPPIPYCDLTPYRRSLVESMRPTAARLAREAARRYPAHAEEIRSAAWEALVEAAIHWESSMDRPWPVYAETWVNWAIAPIEMRAEFEPSNTGNPIEP